MTFLLGLGTIMAAIYALAGLAGPNPWPALVLFGILLFATVAAYAIENRSDE